MNEGPFAQGAAIARSSEKEIAILVTRLERRHDTGDLDLLRHELVLGHHRRWHPSMAGSHGTSRKAQGVAVHGRHGCLHVAVLWWWSRLIIQGAKLVLLGLEIVIGVNAHLAIGTGLVSPTMSETKG